MTRRLIERERSTGGGRWRKPKAAGGGGAAASVRSVGKGSVPASTSSQRTTGESFSPTANALQLFAIMTRRGDSQDVGPMQSVTGCGLTWVRIGNASVVYTGATRYGFSLFRALGASPTPGQLTFDIGLGVSTLHSYSLIEIPGVNTGGTNGSAAIANVGGAYGSSGAPSVTMGGAPAPANMQIGVVGSVGSNGIGAGDGFTLIDNHMHSGFTMWLGFEQRIGGDAVIDATLSPAGNWGMLGLEILMAA